MRSPQKLWEIFDRGDLGDIEDEELRLMERLTVSGKEYLQSRGEALALKATVLDLHRIRDVLKARRDEDAPADRRPRPLVFGTFRR